MLFSQHAFTSVRSERRVVELKAQVLVFCASWHTLIRQTKTVECDPISVPISHSLFKQTRHTATKMLYNMFLLCRFFTFLLDMFFIIFVTLTSVCCWNQKVINNIQLSYSMETSWAFNALLAKRFSNPVKVQIQSWRRWFRLTALRLIA